jgi:hypothetical protein
MTMKMMVMVMVMIRKTTERLGLRFGRWYELAVMGLDVVYGAGWVAGLDLHGAGVL